MLVDKDCGIQLQTVDSTNTYSKKKEVPLGYWVLAEEQTAGRGRHGRQWLSQGEEKIFFSCKFTLQAATFSLPLLSLFVGSAVLKTLQDQFPIKKSQLALKWPNDIYLEDKKVSGILIESEYMDTRSIFIAGVGINIYGKDKLSTSDYLSETALGKEFRMRIIYSLISHLNEMESILQNANSIQTELDWIYQNSTLRNKKIETTQNGEKFCGIVIGYDRNGFLIVKKDDGVTVSIIDTGPDFRVV